MEAPSSAIAGTGGPGPNPARVEPLSADLLARMSRFSQGAGWAVAAVGVTVVAGWFTGIEILKRGWPTLITMKLHTALCFVALGAGLVVLQRRPAARRGVVALAVAATAVPAMTLVEYATGATIGIDNPFGLDRTVPGPTTMPGRMAPATAVCFALCATSLVAHAFGRPKLPVAPALLAGVTAVLNLMGYLYGVESLYRFTYTSVALHTAAAFVVAALGLLVARPHDGPMALVASTSMGGVTVRRLLPAAVVVPLGTGGLVVFLLSRRATTDAPLVFASFTMAMGLSLGALTWVNAARLRRADELRVDAEVLAVLLARNEERTRRILDTAGDAFVGMDTAGRVTAWNRQAELTFGWPAGEALGRPLDRLIIPEDLRQAHRDGVARYLATGEATVLGRRIEIEALHRDGRRFPAELTAWAVEDDGLPAFNAFVRDVSGRQEAERALHHSNEQLRRAAEEASRQRDFASVLLGAMNEGYLFISGQVIDDVNQQFCDLTGFTRDDLVGLGPPWPFWPPDQADSLAALSESVRATGTGEIEVDLLQRDGTRRPVALSARTVRNLDGSIHGYVGTATDLTDFKRRESRLIAVANRDPLTDLHNRRSIDEQVARLRAGDAVVVLDLDHFKVINDTHGHAMGDETLVAVARCITRSLRGTDWAGRLGGEEFMIVVHDEYETGTASSAPAVVDRLRAAWAAWPASCPRTTFSAGIAVHLPGAEPRQTVARADEAMYVAKRNGRDRTEIWPVAAAPAGDRRSVRSGGGPR
jgi:diguanylate cyclase (GGDEF)-like protein/PAS domain S-box-containing protein